MIVLLLSCVPGHDLEYWLIYDTDTGDGVDEIGDTGDSGKIDTCLTDGDDLLRIMSGVVVGGDGTTYLTRWAFDEGDLTVELSAASGWVIFQSKGTYTAGCPLTWTSDVIAQKGPADLSTFEGEAAAWGPGFSLPWPVDGDPETIAYIKPLPMRGIL